MISVQLIAVVVGLGAVHLTYLYYKRSNFTKKELYFWMVIWLAFIFVALFPRSLNPVVGALGLNRALDLIMIVAFIILFALTFHNYVINKKQERKLTKLVRKLALEDLDNHRRG